MNALFLPRTIVLPALLAASACSSPRATPASEPETPVLSYATPRGGLVSATVFGDKPILSVAATFWSPENAGTNVRCEAHDVGRCSVRTCTPAPTSGRSLTAGALLLHVDAGSIARLEPDETGRYANPASRVRAERPSPWTPGAPVHIASNGGDVPAFAVDLEAPPALTLLEPSVQSKPTVDRAHGFTARWTPGEGMVRVALRQGGAVGQTALDTGIAIDCLVPRADGEGLVPADALTELSPADTVDAMVWAVNPKRVRAGDYDVLVLVNAGGVFFDGALVK